jgi:hypothetical protein
MYIPCSHERVFWKGRPEQFMVALVDFHRQKVSLVAIDGNEREIVDNVPFFELVPVDRMNLSTAKWNARPGHEQGVGV